MTPNAIRQAKLYAERKAEGICVRCGKNEPVPGMAQCDYCLDRFATWRKALRDERRKDGLCCDCGEPAGKFWRCGACRAKATHNNIKENCHAEVA